MNLDLQKWVDEGLLEIHSARPTLQGLEEHLVTMYDTVRTFCPSIVVVDPITNIMLQSQAAGIKSTLIRLIDFLKGQQITGCFISLTGRDGQSAREESETGVSSLMDAWLLLRNIEYNGERNRTLYVVKARGIGLGQCARFTVSLPAYAQAKTDDVARRRHGESRVPH